MTASRVRGALRIFGVTSFAACLSLLFSVVTTPAWADVSVRVEARPVSDPIEAFITITDGTGDPVTGLTAADFTVTIDGDPITIDAGDLTLPPSEDASQHVKVVFVMDYSQSVQSVARQAMEDSVVEFIDNMRNGDLAAIIKFNDTNPDGASVVAPFTEIDHLINSAQLEIAARSDYDGDGTNLLDALELAVNQFVSPPSALPTGPEAIIVISDGGENESSASESEVIELANANSIPLFTIGVGDLTLPGRDELLSALGTETGGEFFPAATDEDIADAYAAISIRLTHEYLITIPSGIGDCAEHTLEVAVAGQAAPATVQFTRRICDTEPNPFTFDTVTGVARGATVQSNTVTITGIEVPAHISIISGEYSIGCDNNGFTRDPGTIENGETVCLQQNASQEPSTSKTTTLTVGGVAETFTTTTRAQGGGGGGGGGGGVSGLLEVLLLGLGAAFFGRRRRVS